MFRLEAAESPVVLCFWKLLSHEQQPQWQLLVVHHFCQKHHWKHVLTLVGPGLVQLTLRLKRLCLAELT